jgi:predicted RNase H-like nuclease
MSMRTSHRGAQLPYQLLASAIPCGQGWLIASAKLQGITMSPESPQIFKTFIEVLDYKPAYQVITVAAPIGLPDEPSDRGRHCDRDARAILGMPRASAIVSAPCRPVLKARTYEEAVEVNGGHLNPVSWRQVRRIAEIDENIAPYWQRTVFEVHPELSYFQLNEDEPVRFSKYRGPGVEEREALLRKRLPGVERIIDARVPRISRSRLLDAAACLWTARRIVSRAVTRIPENPEWDSQGLRMELVR